MSLYLTSEANVRRLNNEIGEFMEFEDPSKARGFLRARVMVNTSEPLTKGCWLPRDNNKDTWVEFRYERLQDFCYCCGRLGHTNNECSFEPTKGEAARYRKWTKMGPIREVVDLPRAILFGAEREGLLEF